MADEMNNADVISAEESYVNLGALPTPKEKDDGTINLDEIKAEDLFNEIVSVGDDGYSPTAIVSVIEKVHSNIQPTAEDPQKNREVVQTINPEYCTVNIYALTDDIWIVELTFDSKDDAYLVELRDQLDRYRDMVMEARMHGSNGQPPEAVPMYTLSFVPYKYGGFGVASFGDPIDYYEIMKGDKRGFHLMFSPNSISFEQVEMTRDELTDIQAEVAREQEEKEGTVYRSSL